jgi:hypothetical protein
MGSYDDGQRNPDLPSRSSRELVLQMGGESWCMKREHRCSSSHRRRKSRLMVGIRRCRTCARRSNCCAPIGCILVHYLATEDGRIVLYRRRSRWSWTGRDSCTSVTYLGVPLRSIFPSIWLNLRGTYELGIPKNMGKVVDYKPL